MIHRKKMSVEKGIGLNSGIRLAGIVALTTVLVACSSDDSEDFSSNWNGSLTPCQSCGELDGYLKNSAARMVRMAYEQPDSCYRMVWLPGLPGQRNDLGFGIDPISAPENGGKKNEYSSTNVQEAGVDEPDIVKSDGDHIYVFNGDLFLIYDVSLVLASHEISRLKLEYPPQEMFVSNGLAVLFSSSMGGTYPIFEGQTTVPGPYDPGTVITIIDLNDLEKPKIIRELKIKGYYSTARLMDGIVHVIISSYLSFPVFDAEAGVDDNLKKIEQTPLESWIPTVTDTVHHGDGQKKSTERTVSCESFYLPGSVDVTSLLMILSIDLDKPLEGPKEATAVSATSTAYASKQNIYVSHGHVLNDCSWGTAFHKFDITGTPGQAVYGASGSATGRLLNQFSMGEKDGFLRVATTSQDSNDNGSSVDTNNVFVLEQKGAALEVVGSVTGIAKGEQIYSARFLGDVGFMVTLEQIDPFFTFDLSDPYHPKLMGELIVPGVSTYIHPIDDNYVLTIGQDFKLQAGGLRTTGIQISIYDISDLKDPILIDMEIIGKQGTWSEALNNHKAFNYFAPQAMLSFPILLYDSEASWIDPGCTFSGFYLYNVDPAKGYEFNRAIDHDALYSESLPNCRYSMKRTINIGDNIVTLSTAGMMIHNLDNLDQAPVVTLPFPN